MSCNPPERRSIRSGSGLGFTDGVDALCIQTRGGKLGGGKGPLVHQEHAPTLTKKYVQWLMGLRRGAEVLFRYPSARELERLQGFPDDYTLIPGASHKSRSESLGNSMSIQVMRWLGERIGDVDGILQAHAATA